MQRRRTWALVSGAVVIVVMAIAAVVLWVAGDRRYDDNVAGFARAPVGCDTTLAFDGSGEFVLFIETTGEVAGVAGDCDVAERYDRSANGLPRPDLTLRDPGGDVLRLGPTGGVTYDTGEFIGTAYRLVDIESTGEHVLTVGPTAGEPFAVAVGRDPNDGVALFQGAAIAALVAGLVGGGVLLVFGSRRPPRPTAGPEPWSPASDAAWPVSPPGFPAPPPTTGASGPAGPPLAPPPSSAPSSAPPSAETTGPPGPPATSPWAPPR